jgi:hypothetical protein
MIFKSDSQRKAVFYRMGHLSNKFSNSPFLSEEYHDFNVKTDKEIVSGIKHRLHEKSLHDFIKETDKEFNDKVKSTRDNFYHFKPISNHSSDKSCESKSSARGFIVSQKNIYNDDCKFAASPERVMHLEIDPYKYNAGVVIEEAIRSYDLNKSYYDKYGISKDDIIVIELAKNNMTQGSVSS